MLLALAVLLLVSSGATTAVAAECHGTAATASDSRSGDDRLSYPPPDLETVVTLFPTAGRVELHVQYPARSAAEADRYEDGTVDLEWVGADDRLSTAFVSRPGSLSRRCDTVTGVTDPVASESEYGDAGATMSYRWAGVFDGNRSELVVGPTLNANLANGTVVEVRVPAAEWTAERSTVDAYTDGNHGQTRVYGWTVGETDEEPQVVFNESVTRTDTPVTAEDGALGPSGGIGTTLLAMLSVALIESTRRGRRD